MATESLDRAKKQLADEREARAKAQREHEDKTANLAPTPTQEENDLAKLGEHVLEKEHKAPDEPGTTTATARPAATPKTSQSTLGMPKRGE